MASAKIARKSKTTTIIKPVVKTDGGVDGWLNRNAIKRGAMVILHKRVSNDWKTQEGTSNETVWRPGTTLTHPSWAPKDSECGLGKYHACSRAYFCDEFRDKPGDRYVAIKVAKKDLHAWDGGDYPHKIAFRKGTVLYECDHLGRKIE